MNNDKKKWYWIGGIVIVLLIVLFAGHVKKNGGLTTPKEISFGKTGGERIWYTTHSGKGKDSIIDSVDVTKGNKMIEYQIFDDDVTLGKLSKMSNREVINMAKKQDRKYFDESINEVKALRDHKDQIGLNDDLMSDDDLKGDLNWGPYLYFLVSDRDSDNHKWSDPEWITSEQYNNNNSSKMRQKWTEGQMPNSLIQSNGENGYDRIDNLVKQMRNDRFNALIVNMKSVKYLSPKWQKITITSNTDDTGNKVVSEKIKYKYIDEFNYAGTVNQNAQKLSESKKQEILDIVGGNQRDTDSQLNACKKAFDSSYYHQITKNVFKPHAVSSDFTIYTPTSQTIYDSRFIGYSFGNGSYYLTKAQNDNQKAVFSK